MSKETVESKSKNLPASSRKEDSPAPVPQKEVLSPLPSVPREEFEKKEKELTELNDKYLRLLAEFENYKKRISREQLETMKYAYEPAIREFLPVLDNLERALFHSKEAQDIARLNEGLQLILKQSQEILSQLGVLPIPARGGDFDPAKHQAIAQVETDEIEENRVVEEVSKGYFFKDRILRPAMVTVSRKKSAGPEKGDASQ